eukprot:scaffold24025_cov54-Phaeocystis_antarctica.AAC.2
MFGLLSGVTSLPPLTASVPEAAAGTSLPQTTLTRLTSHPAARPAGGMAAAGAIDASALRARRRWRGRCAPGCLRRAFERGTCATGDRASSSGSFGGQRLGGVGGWRPSVKARECGGGGAWRWRRVKGREGAYGGCTRAQRSRRRRRASRMRVGGDNLRTLPG